MAPAPLYKRDSSCPTAGTSASTHLHGAPMAHLVTSSIPGASWPGSAQSQSRGCWAQLPGPAHGWLPGCSAFSPGLSPEQQTRQPHSPGLLLPHLPLVGRNVPFTLLPKPEPNPLSLSASHPDTPTSCHSLALALVHFSRIPYFSPASLL